MSASPTEQKPAATAGLAAKYRPADHEPGVSERWAEARAFHADPAPALRGEKPPYCIFIPPPNVTARLHLGHALNNTLQDVLARAHRMRGFEVLWMPGTDHAGIATQAVVEQRLRKEGKLSGPLRSAMTREAFVAQVQDWKDEYEAAITDQLKKLGCSCDWERQRFTMDEICARAVREAFFRLFRDGLIYRGKRLVNWDPVSQTALADDEVEMEEVDGHFYYLRYPLVQANGAGPVTWGELAKRGYPGAQSATAAQQAWVTVATTRPETYLGDTAVGVNPRDPRAKALRGLHCRLPLVGRVIPVIEDDYVVMPAADPNAEGIDPKAKFATGFLKVTPAHDTNDYELGRRHNLSTINIMAPDASISDKHGWTDIGEARQFIGLSRERAREAVLAAFKNGRIPGSNESLLEKVTPYRHSVGHSYRSHVPIEPYLSDQWYCRVTDERMKGAALRSMSLEQRRSNSKRSETGDGALTFFPSRYAKTFESWHEGLRDWCISRQLWWGHQIPVWHKRVLLTEKNWVDELSGKAGLDHVLSGEWNGATAAIFRASDGARVDHRQDLSPDVPSTSGEYDIFVCALKDKDMTQFEQHGYRRDPDVLDTWFSSALWPISTLGWPEPPADMKGLLEAFNPSSVLATAREIITLWVSRMVMFNRYLLPATHPESSAFGDPDASGRGEGPVPFRHVYINAVVQDGHGQRMSKSLGNGVDPLDIVHSHGTDALRFLLCQTATSSQDVRMPVDLSCPHCEKPFEPAWITSPAGYKVASPTQTCPHCSKPSVSAYGVSSGSVKPTPQAPQARNSSSRFDAGRNFVTKLWNAARFTMMNLESAATATAAAPVPGRSLPLVDRWMLSRLARTMTRAEGALAEYDFSGYAEAMYDLVWRDFCDWYLEAIKPTIKTDVSQRAVLHQTLSAIIRLLHPVCPFVTEVLHGPVQELTRGTVEGLDLGGPSELGCLAAWPVAAPSLVDERAETEWAELQALVAVVRETRSAKGVEPRRKITLHLHHFASLAARAAASPGVIESLAGLDRIEISPPPAGATAVPFAGKEIALTNLADAADPEAERALLIPLLGKLDRDIAALESRLNNPGYAAKAPPKLVEETRAQLTQKQSERDAAAARLRELGS